MASATLAISVTSPADLRLASLTGGFGLKPLKLSLQLSSRNVSLKQKCPKQAKAATNKGGFTIQASYSGGGGKSSNATVFVGGFILGGMVVGTLGCVFAPQISKALAGTDRKDLMRKLPKFIYDEEKALEKTRKVLTEKIAQLNSAIDDVSSQLRANDDSNGAAAASPDELETAI